MSHFRTYIIIVPNPYILLYSTIHQELISVLDLRYNIPLAPES